MKNKKLLELILWLLAAIIATVIFFSGLNNPKEYFDKKGADSNVSSICSEPQKL